MARPPVTRTRQVLPFERLSPEDFERLCLWLVRRQGYEEVRHLGAAGSEQGRDLVAHRAGRRVAFQCKRVRSFSFADAKMEIAKVKSVNEAELPDELVFLLTCHVRTATRSKAEELAAPLRCSFVGLTELDEQVKGHPAIIEEFFDTRPSSKNVQFAKGPEAPKSEVRPPGEENEPPPVTDPQSAMRGLRPSAFRVGTAFILVALVIGISNEIRLRTMQADSGTTAKPRAGPGDLVIVVTPFFGPDRRAEEEGRIMALLLERNLRARLGKDGGIVLGIDVTLKAVRSHEAARQLGANLNATAVIWGEVIAVADEIEILPRLTLVPEPPVRTSEVRHYRWGDPFIELAEKEDEPLLLVSSRHSQLELRRTTAAGIANLAVKLGIVHALYREGDPSKAIRLLNLVPEDAEALRLRAEAFAAQKRLSEALKVLSQVVSENSEDGQAWGLIGDLHLQAVNLTLAAEAYTRASKRSFSTEYGTLYEGMILRAERVVRPYWASDGTLSFEQRQTPFLLLVEPTTGKIINRYIAPGRAVGFENTNGAITVTIESSYAEITRQSIPLKRITAQVSPSQRLLWLDALERISLSSSGLSLADNFLGDLRCWQECGTARLQPRTRALATDRPQTLAELEAALLRAQELDSTQPWHSFFLGQVFWAQGRRQLADETWQRLAAGDYPAFPFSAYSRMANYFERFGQSVWAKKFEEIAQEMAASAGLPRGIQSGFSRQIDWPSTGVRFSPATRARPLQLFGWYQRRVELTGADGADDEVGARVWERLLAHSGHSAAAKEAASLADQAARGPLNLLRILTLLQYSTYVSSGSVIGLAFLVGYGALRAHQGLRLLKTSARFSSEYRETALGSQGPRWSMLTVAAAKILMVLIQCFILLLIWIGLWFGEAVEILAWLVLLFVGLCLCLAPILMTALLKRCWDTRWTFVVATVMCLVSLAIVGIYASRAHAVTSVPLGARYWIGHLGTLANMDRSAETGGRPRLFVRAVGYHVAGDLVTAERLYKKANGGDFRVVENLAALERGAPPKHFPGETDLTTDRSISTWDVMWRGSFTSPMEADLSAFDRMIVIPGRVGSFLLYLVLLLLAASWILRRALSALPATERPPSVASRVLGWFVLGFGWIRLGRPFVALFVATLFAFFTVAVVVCATAGIEAGTPGPITAEWFSASNFALKSLWPQSWRPDDQLNEHYRWKVFWAFPLSGSFWGIVIVSGLVAVGLHGYSFVKLGKRPREGSIPS